MKIICCICWSTNRAAGLTYAVHFSVPGCITRHLDAGPMMTLHESQSQISLTRPPLALSTGLRMAGLVGLWRAPSRSTLRYSGFYPGGTPESMSHHHFFIRRARHFWNTTAASRTGSSIKARWTLPRCIKSEGVVDSVRANRFATSMRRRGVGLGGPVCW
jgi:hypothetical protein